MKCLPRDTYLAIIITNPAESEMLKFFKDEEGCDAEVVRYLSVTKVVLIPRQEDTKSLLSYSIANLHKYPHGTLLINTEQDKYFKEATAHLEVMLVDRGSQFDDQISGIHVKYDDPDHIGYKLIDLLKEIAPLMDPSCSSARKVPFVSCGWSTANAHEYKNNRSNMVGSIAPFLIAEELPIYERCPSIWNVCSSYLCC
jgi:hypothetical protein